MKTKELYLKVCQKNGKGLFYSKDQSRPLRFIEESDLDENSSKECGVGIYFITPDQLPLWWQPDITGTEIRVVKPLGKIIKLSKGYRTNRLHHVRLLKESELQEIEKEHRFCWKYRVQTAGDKSTQIAGAYSVQTAGAESTQTAKWNSNQTAGDKSTQTAGAYSVQTAGTESTQTAGTESTQTAGYNSVQTAGTESTQTAGDYSTQTAGAESTQTAGDNSTQIIYGDISYIILNGKNVITRQIYFDSKKNQNICKIIDHNKLLKKYIKGTKLEIKKGKVKLANLKKEN